jgi:hypothetical protein
MNQAPVLSVILVSYNVSRLLDDCLVSLEREIAGMEAEVFVVDNASRDDSVAMVREKHPAVRLIASPENLGFAKANNLALKECRGRYVLLLNPDTLVHEGALRQLVRYLDEHPEVGAVGPAVRLADGSIQPECARNLPALNNLFPWILQLDKTASKLRRRLLPPSLARQRGEPPRWNLLDRLTLLSWERDITCAVECLSGACMMVRREIIQRIGPLDESLLIYLDDTDYCQRVRAAGAEIHYVAGVSITHLWQQSSAHLTREGKLYAMTCHSKWLFLRKHRGPFPAAVFSVMALLAAPVRIAVCLGALTVTRGQRRLFWQRQMSMALGLSRWAFSWNKQPPISSFGQGK